MAPDRTRSIYRPPWRIDLTVRTAALRLGERLPVSGAALADLVARTLDVAAAPAPASIALILADDVELEDLNRRYMGAAGPTDVLSFPLLAPGAFPPHPGRDTAAGAVPFPMPPGARTHLGDIVLSVARAREQAAAGRGGQTGDVAWSFADELRLLTVHGVLHVCGWDHADRTEADTMRGLERELLAAR